MKVDYSLCLATNSIGNDLVIFAINLWCSLSGTSHHILHFLPQIQTSLVLKIERKMCKGIFYAPTRASKKVNQNFLNFLPRHVFAENGYVKVDYNSLRLATNLIGNDLVRIAINLWCSISGTHSCLTFSPSYKLP